MHMLKTCAVALGLVALAAGQAQAADETPTPESYADMGFYLRGDIGWSFLEWGGGQDDDGLSAGAGVGYQVNDQIRADLRYDWAGQYHVAPGADMNVSTVLGNLYFDIPTDMMLTPHLGAGLGYGWANVDGAKDKDGFAYALMGGASVSLTDSIDLDVEYRFRQILSSGSDPMEHQVTTGVRFKF